MCWCLPVGYAPCRVSARGGLRVGRLLRSGCESTHRHCMSGASPVTRDVATGRGLERRGAEVGILAVTASVVVVAGLWQQGMGRAEPCPADGAGTGSAGWVWGGRGNQRSATGLALSGKCATCMRFTMCCCGVIGRRWSSVGVRKGRDGRHRLPPANHQLPIRSYPILSDPPLLPNPAHAAHFASLRWHVHFPTARPLLCFARITIALKII